MNHIRFITLKNFSDRLSDLSTNHPLQRRDLGFVFLQLFGSLVVSSRSLKAHPGSLGFTTSGFLRAA